MDIRPYQFTVARGYVEPSRPVYAVFLDEHSFIEAYRLKEYSPAIDFGSYVLVAVHRGICPSAGYHVRLTEAFTEGGLLIVRVALEDPGKGMMNAAVITHPRAFGLIERAALPDRQTVTVHLVGTAGELIATLTATTGTATKA